MGLIDSVLTLGLFAKLLRRGHHILAQHTELSNPPLREALIDLQIEQELPPSFVNNLRDLELGGFPAKRLIKRGQFSIQVAKDKPASASVRSDEDLGWRCDASDSSRVVQLRRNGVTFSILKSYTNWADLRAAALGVWRLYLGLSGPVMVKRIAVRYINVIQLPLGGADFSDYLTAGPMVPTELPQFLSGFLHRVVVPFAPGGPIAIITQALEPATNQGIPLILDIDVYREGRLSSDSNEMWAQLDNLREIKNLIFFASVTEKALEPFR